MTRLRSHNTGVSLLQSMRTPNPALPCPALPCPAPISNSPPPRFARKKASQSLPNPLKPACEGRSVCWKPLLLVERPAQAARTHNPTTIHLSLWFLVKSNRLCVDLRWEAESKKAPLRGVWGELGWLGRDYMLTQARDKWARPYS